MVVSVASERGPQLLGGYSEGEWLGVTRAKGGANVAYIVVAVRLLGAAVFRDNGWGLPPRLWRAGKRRLTASRTSGDADDNSCVGEEGPCRNTVCERGEECTFECLK